MPSYVGFRYTLSRIPNDSKREVFQHDSILQYDSMKPTYDLVVGPFRSRSGGGSTSQNIGSSPYAATLRRLSPLRCSTTLVLRLRNAYAIHLPGHLSCGRARRKRWLGRQRLVRAQRLCSACRYSCPSHVEGKNRLGANLKNECPFDSHELFRHPPCLLPRRQRRSSLHRRLRLPSRRQHSPCR